MLNQTRKERVSEIIRKRSKQNKVYRFFAPVIRRLSFGAIAVSDFCAGNLLKFSLICTSGLCFMAFCSFSFPLFTGSVTNLGIIDFNELDESISLANEDSNVMTMKQGRCSRMISAVKTVLFTPAL